MPTKKNSSSRSQSPAPTRGRGKSPSSSRGRKEGPRGRSLTPPKTTAAKSVAAVPAAVPQPVVKPKAVPPSHYDYDAVKVPEHQDDEAFLKAVERCLPSEFVLIASQDDVSEAQEDFFAMDHFQLKPPEGKARWLNSELAGSVATCALLQMMQERPDCWTAKSATDTTTKPFSTLEILQQVKQRIFECSKQHANPTITASRPLGPPQFPEESYMPYYVVPPTHTRGTRRALLIACVAGEPGDQDLRGTINDVNNIQTFLLQHCGFQQEHMTVLQETYKLPANQQPTKKNITDGFKQMVKDSKPGDVNFIQFSGHGNRNANNNLYILPSDYKQSGYIQDERILKNLIKAMPRGVYTTMLVDCCYSGTIGDLPYILKADSTEQQIEGDFDTTIRKSQRGMMRPGGARSGGGGRMSVRQSIRTFYDTDTLKEVEQKEAQKDPEYEKVKAARKKKTLTQLLEETTSSAKRVGDKLDDAFDKAIESVKKTGTKAKRAVRSLSPLRRKRSKSPKRGEEGDSDPSLQQPKSSSELTKSQDLDDDEDINIPVLPKSKTNGDKSPVRKTKSDGTKPKTTPKKSPVRKTKTHPAAAPKKPKASSQPLKSSTADDDERDFEAAVAKAGTHKPQKKKATTTTTTRGRSPKKRSQSPARTASPKTTRAT